MSPIECLLWDFGDTLCDERFIWSSGAEWMEVYHSFDDGGLGAQWNVGAIDTKVFATHLAARMGRSSASIVDHMIARCGQIQFYRNVFEFFKSHHLPQAIVTVNPDIFTTTIAPKYDLASFCEVIVTSWEEGTDNKRRLCDIALAKMGLECSRASALLLDNKQTNVSEWVEAGGAAYLYVDDTKFAKDIEAGIDMLGLEL